MAKKKNRKQEQTIHITENQLNKYDNKYIGIIKETVSDEADINQMIQALSIINAQLITISINPNFVEKEKEKIIEAFEYVYPKVMTSEENEEKILENWFGNYPLLFRMGSTFLHERELENFSKEYNNLSKFNKHLYNQIFTKIWNTRANRHVVVCEDDIEIPKTIYSQDLDIFKVGLKQLLLSFFKEDVSSLVFTYEKKDKIVCAALRKVKTHITIVDVNELKECYSYDPQTGLAIDPPADYEFTEFNLQF